MGREAAGKYQETSLRPVSRFHLFVSVIAFDEKAAQESSRIFTHPSLFIGKVFSSELLLAPPFHPHSG